MPRDPLGSVYYTRRRVNEAFLRAALEDFHKNGAIALDRCAREQPASYLKIFALLMPREIKLEHQNPTDALSDEQLALMVAELEERISARLQGESAKLIDAQAEPEPRGAAIWRGSVAEEEPQDTTCSTREGSRPGSPVGRGAQGEAGCRRSGRGSGARCKSASPNLKLYRIYSISAQF